MKKIIIAIMIMLMIVSSVFAWTLDYSYNESKSTFTKNDGTILYFMNYDEYCQLYKDKYTHSEWIEPRYDWVNISIWNEFIEEWQVHEEYQLIEDGYYNTTTNCLTYDFELSINNSILEHLSKPLQSKTRDVYISGNLSVHNLIYSPLMMSSDYLYASKGYYSLNITNDIEILLNTKTMPDGTINKYSYPSDMITVIQGTPTLKLGQALDFVFNIIRWFVEDYLNMKEELCSNNKKYSWCTKK